MSDIPGPPRRERKSPRGFPGGVLLQEMAQALRNATTAMWPPKPNELLIASR